MCSPILTAVLPETEQSPFTSVTLSRRRAPPHASDHGRRRFGRLHHVAQNRSVRFTGVVIALVRRLHIDLARTAGALCPRL
ncbi:putative leader peptide [Pseudonocardia sp. HH130629-09]|uniref:putative leader peptide n=1 Tax=Pseudonocardia sp. HH130629-09 TaxID=1641402 RepID=UPI0039C9C0BA